MTIRADEELIRLVKLEAEAAGRSMNDLVVHVLRIMFDPSQATTKDERIVARLRAAGLLHEFGPDRSRPRRPAPEELAEARKAFEAAPGPTLSEIVSMDRGE